MYAMLTGCLPYTVEPFNITALHAKMLENKMNPIPDHLSACKFIGTACWCGGVNKLESYLYLYIMMISFYA